jgi:phenylpropionate dioxygenase-like ring-hydroxylating dioxygenase large terminal subunit
VSSTAPAGPRWADTDIQALVQPHQVHRDLYLDPALFELEMQRLWARCWLYVGHASQVPEAGDFITVQLGSQPVLMLRRADGGLSVLLNRCAHKGSMLTREPCGNAGRTLRCPYHAWSYRLDGSLLGIPLRDGYAARAFADAPAQQGLAPYGDVAVHRGFVFARAAPTGESFDAWAGELRAALDLLADRSPQGELRVAGGVLRTVVHANWKIYLENINDAVHPVSAHQSANDAARGVWAGQPEGTPAPISIQQLLPFGSGHEFFQKMGGRVLPHGHSVLGTRYSIHSAYAAIPGYAGQLRAAHGDARAEAVLSFTPQNVVFYPTIALKGAPQVLRVLRPLAVDRTLVEAWAFEPVGAPAALLESALTYNRSVFSPASIVAADDLHLFEAVQHGLAAQSNPWVSLHRDARDDETVPRDVSGIDEALLRNQYQAWAQGMRA